MDLRVMDLAWIWPGSGLDLALIDLPQTGPRLVLRPTSRILQSQIYRFRGSYIDF